MAATRDPAGPPALSAWPLRAVGAAGTYRPVVLVPTCDRFDDSAARAGRGQLAALAPRAHPTAVRAGQWTAGAGAYRARRLGQRRASLAQLVYQPAHHRWCAQLQRIRARRQRRGEVTDGLRAGRDGVHRGPDRQWSHTRDCRGSHGDDLLAAAQRATPSGLPASQGVNLTPVFPGDQYFLSPAQ